MLFVWMASGCSRAEDDTNPASSVSTQEPTLQDPALEKALRDNDSEVLLEKYWTTHSEAITQHYLERYPILKSQGKGAPPNQPDPPVELTLPNEKAMIGDDGGRIVWAHKKEETGKAGFTIGERYETLLKGDEFAIHVQQAGRSWFCIRCPLSSARLFSKCDGTQSLREMASKDVSEPDLAYAFLLLHRYRAVEWSPKKRAEPVSHKVLTTLAQVPGEAQESPTFFITRIYDCFWGE